MPSKTKNKMQQKQQQKQTQQQTHQQQQQNDARTFMQQLFPKNGPGFYPKLEELAAKARNGDKAAQKTIEKINDEFKNNPFFHDEITNQVRDKAKKGPNDVRGVGQDELFQTAETMEWLNRSAGMVKGVKPVSHVTLPSGKTETLTWLGAQRNIRYPTSEVFTKAGEGHPGALLKQKGSLGFLTKGSPGLHKQRNALIKAEKTPLKAARTAVSVQVQLTPNLHEAKKVFNKGVDVRGNDLGTKKGKKAFHGYQERGRDFQKSIEEQYLRTTSPSTKVGKRKSSPYKDPTTPKYKLVKLEPLSEEYNKQRKNW